MDDFIEIWKNNGSLKHEIIISLVYTHFLASLNLMTKFKSEDFIYIIIGNTFLI